MPRGWTMFLPKVAAPIYGAGLILSRHEEDLNIASPRSNNMAGGSANGSARGRVCTLLAKIFGGSFVLLLGAALCWVACIIDVIVFLCRKLGLEPPTEGVAGVLVWRCGQLPDLVTFTSGTSGGDWSSSRSVGGSTVRPFIFGIVC